MTIFGDGRQTRAFSYIGDVAPLMARAIAQPDAYNEVFNIGADQPTSVNELAELVARALGVPVAVTRLEPRKEVVHAFADHSKIERVFGYRAQWSLADGLERMAAWAKSAGPAKPSPRQHIELTRNLPPSWSA